MSVASMRTRSESAKMMFPTLLNAIDPSDLLSLEILLEYTEQLPAHGFRGDEIAMGWERFLVATAASPDRVPRDACARLLDWAARFVGVTAFAELGAVLSPRLTPQLV
eukprot:TRINITY_DN26799_c0_g1_i1.p1 TRINITY_DN26799_c0_g1~~TRINITY_DN26799_c0_g1_i1.p1  ORF type:complete len:108 (+),score=13.25 TRINITY_DN26799_c0_g1_i1:734-1057(+)